MNHPSSSTSRHLGVHQILALEAIGDVLIPGDEDLPSFSRLGCVAHVDRLLDYMPDDDLRGLRDVLAVGSFLPRFLVVGLLYWLEAGFWPSGPWVAPLRVVRLGLRGIVFSLYYSGGAGPGFEERGPLEVLSYCVGVAVEDVPRPVLESMLEE